MEVSISSCSTQTQRCYNCISSWYNTFFNITLPQFPSGGGTPSCFSQGSPPRQCCALAFSISFHNRQELFPSPPGCLSLLSIISGCHHQDRYRAASILQSELLHSEGDGPRKAGSSPPLPAQQLLRWGQPQITQSYSHTRGTEAAQNYSIGKEEEKSNVPKATLKMSPMD